MEVNLDDDLPDSSNQDHMVADSTIKLKIQIVEGKTSLTAFAESAGESIDPGDARDEE
jgi:hypothetical protein